GCLAPQPPDRVLPPAARLSAPRLADAVGSPRADRRARQLALDPAGRSLARGAAALSDTIPALLGARVRLPVPHRQPVSRLRWRAGELSGGSGDRAAARAEPLEGRL